MKDEEKTPTDAHGLWRASKDRFAPRQKKLDFPTFNLHPSTFILS
jgi:hypothetical protein